MPPVPARSSRSFPLAVAALVCLLVPAALAGPTPAQTLDIVLNDSGWSYVKDGSDGVKIYKKEIPDSPYYAYKGTVVTTLDPVKFRTLITDIPKARGMSDKVPVRDSEFLAGNAKSSQFDYYQYLDAPGWTLAADRWWINRGWLESGIGGQEHHAMMKWKGLDERDYPDKVAAVTAADPDAIFVPHNVGYWEVEPVEGGQHMVTYAILTDPGGRIPAKLQNLVTQKTLPDTIMMYVERCR